MGTNYYLSIKPPCECCGRPFEQLHIGKSSGGWCFSLHVIPEKGINTLADWIAAWSKDGVHIEDEYGATVAPVEMLDRIANRSRDIPCNWTGHELAMNNAVLGPNNLVRHRVDGSHCIGHGEGTWDLITGEFS